MNRWPGRACDDDQGQPSPALRTPMTPDEGVPCIHGLSAGLIPLREFALHKWYFAHPLWYYHQPAMTHQLRADESFFELVDPALRELCRAALAAGLATTPSCQGHFYLRTRFEAIWDELEEESTLVRGSGLIVQDCETSQRLLFQKHDFVLPWAGRDDFCAQAMAHQTQGFIGLALPPERAQLQARLVQDSFATATARIALDLELTQVLGQPLFGIHVDANSPSERDAAWRAVTDYVCDVLQTTGAHSDHGAADPGGLTPARPGG